MKKLIKPCLGTLLATWLLTTYATTTQSPVGVIDQFDGTATDYLLKRQGKEQSIALFMPLLANDIIIIKNKRHTVQLILQGETQPVTVSYSDSPFTVQPTGKVPGKADNFWESTKKFFSYWFTITQPNVPKPVHSKGTELSMPLLEKQNIRKPALLTAGKRALSVAWLGGKAPFQVQLATSQKKVLFTVQTEKTSVTLPQFSFETDKAYRITIKNVEAPDWQRAMIRGFQVIAHRPESDELKNAHLPRRTRQTLQAAWLAKQHGKQWSFEAYQLAAGVKNYAPAQALQEALIWGRNR